MSEKVIPFNQLGKAGYNRPINRSHVNEIKRDFRADMVQPAIVSFRDGRYWIIDHQHQTQAIYEMNNCDPNTPIRCDVRTGLTYEQESDLYYRLNTGSQVLSFLDKLVGRIEAKDPEALEFRSAVESCGYIIGGNTNRSLKAVTVAWKVFKKDGYDGLVDLLTLINATWPNNKNAVSAVIIDGVRVFMRSHQGEYSTDRFIKALSRENPREILNKATDIWRAYDSKSRTKPYCVYNVILDAYNYGLKHKLTVAAPGTF